ncbi:MAG: hypothetical protein PHR47_02325 [Candidatus Pacebacteria bacterium]|nr:hypothetical protein [Candidatus Paceibacterota bacterium]
MAKIELNKEQYLKILKAIEIFGMMEEFIENEESEEALANKNYEFEEYLLGFANEFGLKDRDDEEWFDDLMSDAYDMANEYGETDMYQRLAWELAVLNFKEKYKKDFDNDNDDDFKKAMALEDGFLDEFEENGLNNIKIVK